LTKTVLLFLALESSRTDDFFGSFDDAKAMQLGGGGDGFDSAALSSAWGEAIPTSEGSSMDDQVLADDFDTSAPPSNDVEDDLKRSEGDQRRSSRRRQPGGRNFRSNRPSVEAGVESVNINDTENGASDGDRRDRRGDDPRKRSSSKARRKGRDRGTRTEKADDGEDKKMSSFRNPFNRKQSPTEP
jgi:hypothetical protein